MFTVFQLLRVLDDGCPRLHLLHAGLHPEHPVTATGTELLKVGQCSVFPTLRKEKVNLAHEIKIITLLSSPSPNP